MDLHYLSRCELLGAVGMVAARGIAEYICLIFFIFLPIFSNFCEYVKKKKKEKNTVLLRFIPRNLVVF